MTERALLKENKDLESQLATYKAEVETYKRKSEALLAQVAAAKNTVGWDDMPQGIHIWLSTIFKSVEALNNKGKCNE